MRLLLEGSENSPRILVQIWQETGFFVDLGADWWRKWGVLRAENMCVKKCKSLKMGDFTGINSSNCGH